MTMQMNKKHVILDRNYTRLCRAYNEFDDLVEAAQKELDADWKKTEQGRSHKYAVDKLKAAIKALGDARSAIDEAKELL
jgi:hypothetical protein